MFIYCLPCLIRSLCQLQSPMLCVFASARLLTCLLEPLLHARDACVRKKNSLIAVCHVSCVKFEYSSYFPCRLGSSILDRTRKIKTCDPFIREMFQVLAPSQTGRFFDAPVHWIILEVWIFNLLSSMLFVSLSRSEHITKAGQHTTFNYMYSCNLITQFTHAHNNVQSSNTTKFGFVK